MIPTPEYMERARQRFEGHVIRKEGCWGWKGAKFQLGHPQFYWWAGKAGHRYSYTVHHGPIPPGMMVCHKCDNPECTNPEHLFLGTARDNVHDMISKGRRVFPYTGATHCRKGHEWKPETTYWLTLTNGKTRRYCKICNRVSNQRHRARQKELKVAA